MPWLRASAATSEAIPKSGRLVSARGIEVERFGVKWCEVE